MWLYFGTQLNRHDFVQMKWNESGFRPPLCTYRLNWARKTSWGWWDEWDDTVLQTQDSKFEPWRSEAEHATSRSQRLPTIPTFTRGWGRNTFCFFQTVETGNRTPSSGVKGSGANHYPRAPAPYVFKWTRHCTVYYHDYHTHHFVECVRQTSSFIFLSKDIDIDYVFVLLQLSIKICFSYIASLVCTRKIESDNISLCL